MTAIVGVLLFAATAVPVHAASKTPFEGTLEFTSEGAPERVWVDEDGVVHVRNQPSSGTLSGDLEGTVEVLGNVNIDPATGSGDLFGRFTIETEQGMWSGRYSGTFSGGLGFVEFVGHSPDGSKIMGTSPQLSTEPNIWSVEGIILSPKG